MRLLGINLTFLFTNFGFYYPGLDFKGSLVLGGNSARVFQVFKFPPKGKFFFQNQGTISPFYHNFLEVGALR